MDLNLISAIIFYSLVILFIYLKRDKFIVQSKIVYLYKTKFGLKLMDRIANFCPRFLSFLGYLGVFTGFVGMFFIVIMLIHGAWSLIVNPSALPSVAPIIPGVKIPGSPVYVPFWYGIISLFVIICIHEFSHGVLSRVHKVPVRSSGFGMMAIFPIAFVEPDESRIQKISKKKQLSIFAAGPFSNILTAIIVISFAFFFTFPFQVSMVSYDGVYFSEVIPDNPAYLAGVPTDVVFTHLNNISINSGPDFFSALDSFSPGDTLVLSNSDVSYSIISSSNPENPSLPYLGVRGILSSYIINPSVNKYKFYFFDILNDLLSWIFILSFGIGLANLLPLGPVDGGRMLSLVFNKKKYLSVVVKYLSLFVLFLLLFNLFFPYLRNLFVFFI